MILADLYKASLLPPRDEFAFLTFPFCFLLVEKGVLDELTSPCCVLSVGMRGEMPAAAFLAWYPVKPPSQPLPSSLMSLFPFFQGLYDCFL